MKALLIYLPAMKAFSAATIVTTLTLFLAVETSAKLTSSDAPKPNIIVILADD